MGKKARLTAGERLAQLRVEIADLDKQVVAVKRERRLTIMGWGIVDGDVPISDEMLFSFRDRLAQKHGWLFGYALLISDGWTVPEEGWLKGLVKFPGEPKRPPPVVPPTSPADGGGGSGSSGGGSGVIEITLEESAAVRLAKMAELEYVERIANREEWEKRQPMRAWLLRDQVLRAEIMQRLTGYAKYEDRKIAEELMAAKKRAAAKERAAGG